MTVFTTTWNDAYNTLPPDNEQVAQGASRIRNFKVAVRERLAVNHKAAGDEFDGEHTQITFFGPVATPTAVANKGFLYTKDVGGKAELHYLDEDDHEVQITNAGAINLLPNSVGDIKGSLDSTPSTGWYNMNGQTIGNASSGATQANANMEALFTFMYDTYDNTKCPVSGGRGANAAADFAANKTLTLLNWNGRGPVQVGQGTDSNATQKTFTLGEAAGEYTHTMTVSELVAHTHTYYRSVSGAGSNNGHVSDSNYGLGNGTSASTGSGAAMPWMSPYFTMYFQVYGGV